MAPINEEIGRLVNFWKQQKIGSNGKGLEDIAQVEKKLNIKLPKDFIAYFNIVNGMGSNHLNDTDERGFSFHQLEDLILFDGNFKSDDVLLTNKQFILFADYLQNCWNYLIAVDRDASSDKYSILMYIDSEHYKLVAHSLSEFIDLYIADSSVLYENE